MLSAAENARIGRVAAARVLKPSAPGSIWVTIYGLALLGLIVIYCTILTTAIFSLLQLQGNLVRNLWPPQGLWFIRVNVAAVLVFLMTRLATHLWRCIAGVVTQKYDSAPEAEVGIPLPADEYPAIYAAVAEVGNQVMSPTPDEIRVTYRPECYAVEQRSFSIMGDRRLVLVIGLPQLEVLTQNELKVIIAHELAHFGGGDTRLGVFVFRFLEALRQAREESAESGWRWIDPVAWLSWVYFHLYLVLSAPIRKHQELRADSWSAAINGGDFAARTLLKDWLLSRQFAETLAQFFRTVPRKRTDGNQTVFHEFAREFQDLTPEGGDYLERRLSQEETSSFWDSHPTIPERMQNMRRFDARDLPESIPAYFLLPDFDRIETRLQQQLDAKQPAFPPTYED